MHERQEIYGKQEPGKYRCKQKAQAGKAGGVYAFGRHGIAVNACGVRFGKPEP